MSPGPVRPRVEIRPLPPDSDAVRRFVEELWLPYHRELEATVERHALADAPAEELVAAEVDYRLDRLRETDHRAWVAGGGDLAGFVTTDIDRAPPVFDRPDRLVVGDIYVREPRRGTGLARELVDRAAARARTEGCAELVLDVDVDNERALAFYRKLGFDVRRHRMGVAVDDLRR